MKLYYSPGACSMSPHIVALEAGLKLDVEKVDLGAHKTASGTDYYTINHKGAVPFLQTDDGKSLSEGAAIVQFLADQAPNSGLAPRAGTFERYQLMELLNYIAAEVHKGFAPLFNPAIKPDAREAAVAALGKKFDWLSSSLGEKPYLMGETFTAADAYLFTVLGWTNHLKIDLSKWPVLAAFHARVAKRPKVQEAMRAEGLLK